MSLLIPVNTALYQWIKLCLHLFVDKFQAPIHSHNCLCLVLLQQHRPNLFVDIRIVVEEVEFLLKGVSAYIVRA